MNKLKIIKTGKFWSIYTKNGFITAFNSKKELKKYLKEEAKHD